MSSLHGKVALVTGASRGIGAAVARALSAEGVSLGLASRSGDDLGLPNTVGLPTDVRDLAALEALTAATAERFGGIDIVVANAGVGAYGAFGELSVDHIDEMIDVNLKGTLYTVRAALPYLQRSEAADVIGVSSVAGLRGLPGESVYCASKFGQVGFLRSVEHELREQGIRTSNVAPGGVHTDFAIGTGREEGMPMLAGMMSGEDVAAEVLHALTRPRHLRILTTSFRPMQEDAWG